jgi:hypothetical protein
VESRLERHGGTSCPLALDVHSGPTTAAAHGAADSLDDAKALIEELWTAWLDAAGLKES